MCRFVLNTHANYRAPCITEKVFLRTALVPETISNVDSRRYEGRGFYARINANVNRADIDNNDLRTKSGTKGRSLIRATVDVTHFFKKKKARDFHRPQESLRGAEQMQSDNGGRSC